MAQLSMRRMFNMQSVCVAAIVCSVGVSCGVSGVEPSAKIPAEITVEGVRYRATSQLNDSALVTVLSATNVSGVAFRDEWPAKCPIAIIMFETPDRRSNSVFDSRIGTGCPLLPEIVTLAPAETREFAKEISLRRLAALSQGTYYVAAYITALDRTIAAGEVVITR